VLVASLDKLDANVKTRISNAQRLTEQLDGLAGIGAPVVAPDDVHSYWRYCLRVDPEVVPGGPGALAQALRFYDIAAAPRYIQKPAFHCKVIAEQVTFGTSRWPFTLARPEAVDYAAEKFPGTYAGLEHALVLPWNERMTDEHIDFLATSIREAVGSLEQQ
jgi:dTDP-4-amino-4,6-dideoxygalactose transaminase